MKNILFFLFILSFCSTQAQIISTYAGTGTVGYSGDGGQAANAEISGPFGLAVDDSGNLFIAEKRNHIIRKISNAGIVTTVAGTGVAGFTGDGGPATAAQMNEPWGIAVDKNGNLYFSDHVNMRIRKISKSGIITSIAGGGTAPFANDTPALDARIIGPYGIAVDSIGQVYYTDADWVTRIGLDDRAYVVAGNPLPGYGGDGGPATAKSIARLSEPMSVTVDHKGSVFIGDQGNNVVRKVNKAGIISTFVGNGATGGFYGDGGPASAAGLFGPFNVATDRFGNLYLVDYFNRRVRKVNTAGIINTVAGNGVAGYTGDGGPATTASFECGTGFAINRRGDYFISDFCHSVIRKVTNLDTIDHTGFDETVNDNNKVILFPNPNSGKFTITGSLTEKSTLEVTNILGQSLYSTNITDGFFIQDIELAKGLPDGVYLLHISSGHANETLKFVIRH
ncbi:MAG: hypothetical protein K0Q79_87 [Flavipsychrobacter sp.]|nr:hypothetical protein [Flavipsychrobacter sp.]